MTDPPFLSQFSPQWTDPAYLEEILVQRSGLLAESVELVRESVLTGNKHHLLFIGPRGAGKTHLITLIHHRLQSDDLAEKARFAWLNEDETATSFLRLLILIYRSLSSRYPAEFPAATLTDLAGMEASTAQEKLGQTLLRELRGRTLVLLMENLDSLFRHLPVGEQLNWRAFVQNHPVFATIGTAQALFDGVSDRTEPFFGFFDTRHLEPLSVEEARTLLENIARLHGRTDLLAFLQTPTGQARVSAIHALAGGNPRLYLIFSGLISDAGALDELVRPFEEMVDRQLTSYYQERLRWLSPQQREIVQLLCRHGHPVAVKHIAEGLFTTHNSITGQLKQLREMRYLRGHEKGREVLYELTEPLMRLVLQVKETHNRKPLSLIVDFLRVWHERQEIEQRLGKCDPASLGRAYYAEALALIDSGGPNLRHEILRQSLGNAPPGQCDDEILNHARCLAEETGLAADWVRVGMILDDRKEWDEAVRVFTRVLVIGQASVADIAKALYLRGSTQDGAGRPEEAIADYTRVIKLPGAPAEQVAWSLVNRGFRHGKAERTEEAIADYTRVIELPGAPADQVAMAFYNLGVRHGQAGRPEEAIADFTRAIELPGASAHQVAVALYNRGVTHGQVGPPEDAIADYTRAIELPGAPAEPVAWALVNRGVTHAQAGRPDEAIADYTHAIELLGAPAEQVAKALANRGVSHGQAGRPEAAIADYTRAIELTGAPAESVALALNNRALTHAEAERAEPAVSDFAKLFHLDDQQAMSAFLSPRLHGIAEAVVKAIFSHTTDPPRWAARITEFVGHFGRYDGITQLGEALVKHLTVLAQSPLNHAAWDAWVGCWFAAGASLAPGDQDRLEIPLRLLRTGVDYLKTKEETRLLALPNEERKILRQALGLPEEP